MVLYHNKGVKMMTAFVRHFPGKSAIKFSDYINENKYNKFSLPENISIVSVITKEYQGKACLDIQCENNGTPLINPLKDRYVKWNRYDKPKYILNGLNSVKTEYTLVLDGNDTLIINDLDNLVEEAKNYYNCKVLFNATCYNYPKMVIDDINRRYFGRYKYLNAGVAFGKTEDLKWFYEIVKNEVDKDFHHIDSEQYYVRKAFDIINETIDKNYVKFDYNNELFECMHMR